MKSPDSGSGIVDVKSCPDCGFYFDSKKQECPFCGHPKKSRTSMEPTRPLGAPGTKGYGASYPPGPVSSGLPDSQRSQHTSRITACIRRYVVLLALYILIPQPSSIETIKKYFRLGFFVFVIFALPYSFTGQWISGLIAGLVLIFILYRVFTELHTNTSLFSVSETTKGLITLIVILGIFATLTLIFPIPHGKMPEGQELTRDLITHGIIFSGGIAGYFLTKNKKK